MNGTDHNLNGDNVTLLLGMTGLPREFRIEGIRKLILRDHGSEKLVELFADFIGLSNQVVESSRSVIEDYLVLECNHTRKKARKINLPTLFGALNGVKIAVTPTKGMCGACAFRQGTPANQSAATTCNADLAVSEQSGFLCHDRHCKASGPCAGYKKATATAKPDDGVMKRRDERKALALVYGPLAPSQTP